jgi:hypothetical protein
MHTIMKGGIFCSSGGEGPDWDRRNVALLDTAGHEGAGGAEETLAAVLVGVTDEDAAVGVVSRPRPAAAPPAPVTVVPAAGRASAPAIAAAIIGPGITCSPWHAG